MEYVDFVENVLHAAAVAVDRDHDARLIGVAIAEVARSLELGIDPTGPEFHGSDERMAIIQVGQDLEQLGLIAPDTDYYRIKLTDLGRGGATASLRTAWPKLFEQVPLDDEMRDFLRAAVARSEAKSERFAMMQNTTAKEVFEDL